MTRTLILDYGFARMDRLCQAMKRIGARVQMSTDAHEVKSADLLVLPDGFDHERYLQRGVSERILDAIDTHINRNKPLLAVGTGLFLLTGGYRQGDVNLAGLGLWDTRVGKLDPYMVDGFERPLHSTHLGFSKVVGLDRHPAFNELFAEEEQGIWVYFRHRLYAGVRVPFADVAVAHHGIPFAGAIWQPKIFATQFLPELSGPLGLQILKTWYERAI